MRPLSEEQKELAALAVDQTTRIAKRWSKLRPEYADELQSAAHLAAMKAAETYDEAGGQSWSRWVEMWARCYSVKFLKTRYASQGLGDSSAALDDACDEDSGASTIDGMEAVRALLARLTKRQREICELVYVNGMTPYSAGRTLGIRPENACRLHRGAIEKLRKITAA